MHPKRCYISAKTKAVCKEGIPKKYSEAQIELAMNLLKEYSYKRVEAMTGISKSTLIRAKRANGSK